MKPRFEHRKGSGTMTLGLVLCVLCARMAHSEETAPPKFSLADAGISGSIAFDYFSSNHDIDDREHFPGVNLVVKHRRTFFDAVKWVGQLRVMAQQVGHEHEDAVHANIRSLRYADEVTTELREGYLEYSEDAWRLRVGKQNIVWGRADEINPTDVITPKDFHLLLPEGNAAYRFGAAGVTLDYFPRPDVRLTGVWIPVFSPSLLSLSELPVGVAVHHRPPAVRFENQSAGVQLDVSGGAVDAALSYFYGFTQLPEAIVDRATIDASGPHTRIALENSRQHMIGGDFATSRGGFGFRGEIAYVHTDNPNGRKVDRVTPYVFYVLGIERTIPWNVSVILQYVGRYVVNRVDPERALADPDPVVGVARFLAAQDTFVINSELDTVQNGYSARLARSFRNDTIDCEILGVHSFPRNDFFIRPKIAYDVADGWQLSVGGEIFHGPNHSLFGRAQKNTGAFAEVLYSF